MTTTPRLRELQATRKSIQRRPFQIWDRADGRVEGYKLALEDLRPVLEAAREILDSVESGNGIQWKSFGTLRDALAEVTDA